MKQFLVFVLLFVTLPAFAQQAYLLQLSSGTGFFVNKQGHIITNAHVVRACQSVLVRVEERDRAARIVARDEQRDLAVLQVDGEVPALARCVGISAIFGSATHWYYSVIPGRKG